MKPPRSIDVLGKSWTVVIQEMEDTDYGMCEHAKNRIIVSPKQSTDSMRDTLLHELLHAIDIELQAKMGERRVRLIATGLLQVLRHNKALVAFLTDASA